MITNPTIGMLVRCACLICRGGTYDTNFDGVISDIAENLATVRWSGGGKSLVSLNDLVSIEPTPAQLEQTRRKVHADKYL